MSATTVRRTSAHQTSHQTQQLCFSWVQAEHSKAECRSSINRPLPRMRPASGSAASIPATPVRAIRQLPATAQSPALQPIATVKPLTKKTRVGEVRLGAVMLALLKQYGITDEEIETGLAAITNS